MPKWGEDFDTWEPTQDYPAAPPAKSAQLGQVTPRPADPRPHGLPPSSTGARAASFFQEFNAANEAADQATAERLPTLPYGDNPGIAALIANAQNMLNSDGPDAPGSFGDGFAAGVSRRADSSASLGATSRGANASPGDFSGIPVENQPEAWRSAGSAGSLKPNSGDLQKNGGAGMAPHETGNKRRPLDIGFDSGNGLAYGASLEEGTRGEARRPNRATPAPATHSEGWQKLVSGWEDMKNNQEPNHNWTQGLGSAFPGNDAFAPQPGAAGAAGGFASASQPTPDSARGDSSDALGYAMAPHEPRNPTKPTIRAANETNDGDTAANSRDFFDNTTAPGAGANPAPSGWKSISAATPEGPTKLRFRRVDDNGSTPPPPDRRSGGDGLSPVAMIAAAVLLSLISVGIGVGVGMNLNPTPTPTVTVPATPSSTVEPSTENPDSVSNKDKGSGDDSPKDTASGLSGMKIVLDPGHNGGNAAAWQQIGQNVDDGRGGQHACNTTGTATDDGFTEHEFNWKVAGLLKTKLEAAGATVLLTRDSDVGVGPCVNERGAFAQKVGADAMVSIHANGTANTSVHGFFAMISDPPLHESQKEPSSKLAAALVGALKDSGFTPQNTGPIAGGLWKRSDLATLNFAEVPAVMLELGEMRNPADASLMKTENGRERFATAMFNGLAAWAREARPGANAGGGAAGGTPAGSTGTGGTPAGSTPAGSTGTGSTPTSSTPAGSTGTGSTSSGGGASGTPAGSTPANPAAPTTPATPAAPGS
ncbi:N-acetylmuramoyl-L-alanine amidase [Mobiluncus mulieris]|uniref:N-acetylmuramoyl-L-alanine amidase n=1 Tax=Mobiluncus mulieris TaxID=2052 RepID=UPI0021E1D358|nr:N-acetylmuramoyl-L-alanine amidase [Mobiluncus mulieris]MCV0001923.1 N-acetylmuramoyl-L-alanine amidase [Mobiluncus mulieris]